MRLNDDNTSNFKLRMIGSIVKDAGLVHVTIVFIFIYAVCSVLAFAFDPEIKKIGDAFWSMFQAVTTIGFGDVVATTPTTRILTVVVSLTSVFYLALITGAVVSYCMESMRLRRRQTLIQFIDRLESVDTMSEKELKELAEQVREYRKNQRL